MKGQILWYLEPLEEDVLLALLWRLDADATGLRVNRPDTDEFVVLDEGTGVEGRQISTRPRVAFGDWGAKESSRVTFQLWQAADEDVVVECTQNQRTCRFVFWLSGAGLPEADSICAQVAWRAMTDLRTKGLVVGFGLYEHLAGWDQFFLGQGEMPEVPDFLYKPATPDPVTVPVSSWLRIELPQWLMAKVKRASPDV